MKFTALIIAATICVTKASTDLEKPGAFGAEEDEFEELAGCRDTDCQDVCRNEGTNRNYNLDDVWFATEGKGPSCACGGSNANWQSDDCCGGNTFYVQYKNCWGDDDKVKCLSGKRACCCYYNGADGEDVDYYEAVGAGEKVAGNGPYLRPEIN